MRILKSNRGEGYIDTSVKILTLVVCGGLVFGALFWMQKDTVLKPVNQKIESMFNAPAEAPSDDVENPSIPVGPVDGSSEEWTFNSSNGVISGYEGPVYQGMVLRIPDTVDGVPVTEINGKTSTTNILGNTNDINITQIILPHGLKKIGNNAFRGLKGIQSPLNLPNSLEYIGVNSFTSSSFSGDLVIPDSVTFIGTNAFQGCGFTGRLFLPNNPEFKEISPGAFSQCKFTGDLVIPDSVTKIGGAAFSGPYAFAGGRLTLSANIYEIQQNAFKDTLFEGDLYMPDSITILFPSSFGYMKNLKTVSLPSHLSEVDVAVAFERSPGTFTWR